MRPSKREVEERGQNLSRRGKRALQSTFYPLEKIFGAYFTPFLVKLPDDKHGPKCLYATSHRADDFKTVGQLSNQHPSRSVPAMNTKHLYLTGYRGCGKSTVRHELARRLALPSVDLDEEIERTSGMLISEIFRQSGESGFRELETSQLEQVAALTPHVIALGGGAILRQKNRERIRQTGWCVWLDADEQTLADRIAGDVTSVDRRPSLTNSPLLQEIRDVLAARRPIYQSVSDVQVWTAGRSIDVIVEDILQHRGSETASQTR